MLDHSLIATEFSEQSNLIYLNHAAVAPWPRRTATAVCAFAQENFEQGAKSYPRWLEIETQTRQFLARLINAPSVEDIALLKNTSEGLSLIAYGLEWQAGDNIVISDEEFPSNRVVWQSLAPLGVEVREVNLRQAQNPEQALLNATDKHTRLLSISSVQYASGLRMNLRALGEQCHRQQILFCIDAIQSLGALDFDAQACHADFVVADGHKWMLGPEGVALFYVREELRSQLKLHEFGWHMLEHSGDYQRRQWQIATTARRFECGSPNMLGIHGLQASLSLLLEIGIETISQRLTRIVQRFVNGISSNDQLTLISPQEPERHSGIIAFRDQRYDPARLVQQLSNKNVYCAVRGGAVRFSPHFYLGDDQIAVVLNYLCS